MTSTPPPLPQAQPQGRKPPRLDLCATINWLAFPGLGTILAGRPWGYAQASLMLTGFGLFVGFFIIYIRDFYLMIQTGNIIEHPGQAGRWMGWWGGGLSIVAWLWAGATSLKMLSEKPKV